MTLVLNLDAQTEALLDARARETGTAAEVVAAMLLADVLRADVGDVASELSAEDWAAIDAGIARGDADFAAGRFRSLDEVIADKARGFGIRPGGPEGR